MQINFCVAGWLFFLGAGVSSDFLLLDWKELVRKVLATKGIVSNGSSLESEVAGFRYKFFHDNKDGYLDIVQKELYSNLKKPTFEKIRAINTLGAIAALVMASKRGGVSKIITLNFDDLLEVYLEYHGFITASIYDPIHWEQNADVVVYHPHGFLPSRSKMQRSKDIVFDLVSYGQIFVRGSGWRNIALSILRTHTCLFIGLSGEDMNFMSLLHDSSQKHAILNDDTFILGRSLL